MNRTATESYCVTFEVQVNPPDLPGIKRRVECARQICSACLGRCQKQWRQIHNIPVWRPALCELQTPNRKVKLSPDEKSRQKTLRQQLRAIAHSVGCSEYDFHAYALTVNRHFGSSLGVNEMQKTATSARRTFERYFDACRALYKLHQIPHRQEDCQREEQHHCTQRDDENRPDPFS